MMKAESGQDKCPGDTQGPFIWCPHAGWTGGGTPEGREVGLLGGKCTIQRGPGEDLGLILRSKP